MRCKAAFVENVLLIDVGDQNALPPQVDASAKELRIVRMSDATDQVDVVLKWAARSIRNGST